ncbi:MAG TPA: hypothetical protein VLY85_04295 [Thermoplasmata archaeon]|nr:hypothetical protein [Thermoplasmata archaeon]HUI38832.1 hypothetical protein [Thermoplasmata archaeon]
MSVPAAPGAPYYAPGFALPRTPGHRKAGAILLMIGMILAGVGGALASYCVLDDYGFCTYPDSGAGWGLVFLGFLVLIVGGVLLALKPRPIATYGTSFGPTAGPPTYYPAAPAPPAPPPPPPPPPPPAAPLPSCPTCRGPLVFVPQYGRFYCYVCGRYS